MGGRRLGRVSGGLVCLVRGREEYTLVTAVSETCFIVRVDSFGLCPAEGALLH